MLVLQDARASLLWFGKRYGHQQWGRPSRLVAAGRVRYNSVGQESPERDDI